MIAEIVSKTILVLTIAIFARALLSFVIRDPRNPIWQFLVTVTEPILAPIRSLMPRGMMIDFSPMIAIFLLQFIGNILVQQLS